MSKPIIVQPGRGPQLCKFMCHYCECVYAMEEPKGHSGYDGDWVYPTIECPACKKTQIIKIDTKGIYRSIEYMYTPK